MKIHKAEKTDLAKVAKITRDTISSVYPRYYPAGAVDFFLKYHSDDEIKEDIENGRTYLCYNDEDEAVGTVSVRENDIGRLFVLPEYQGKGCGTMLMDFAEELICRNYDEIVLDASLAAKGIYLKRGYREIEYKKEKTDNGDFLCWDIMIKKVKDK